MDDSEDTGSGFLKVVCRFRPINEKEKAISMQVCVDFSEDNRTVLMKQTEALEPLKFNFDHVFNPDSTQSSVYDISAQPIVESVMQGFNGTVFAYGQTSSGKTFTMTGPSLCDPDTMGIIPRMVETVFEDIILANEHLEFQVKVAYCEIYLEKIRDLLDPSKSNLKIHEDRTRGIYIDDLTERYVSNASEVYELMRIGGENREVAYTHMNAGSSRSHSIFIITISQSNSKDFSAKVGKLYLVDLAGSEKIGKTGAEGKRLEEAKNINKSLTTLGHVISALTDGKSTHIPYRDSKLTRVLQDSLGGNSKTTLIITCSPSPYNESETLSTLRFGIRAKAIKNKPKINKEYTVGELKLMLNRAKDDIIVKEKRIRELEKIIDKSGIEICEILLTEEDLDQDSDTETEEIIQELEEMRLRLSKEVESNCKLKQEFSILKEDFDNITILNEFLTKELDSANFQIKRITNESSDHQEKVSIYEDTNDKLHEQLRELRQRELELEQILISKDVQIEHRNLQIDQLKNTYEEHLSLIQSSSLHSVDNYEDIQTSLSVPLIASFSLEEIFIKEKEVWEDEKKTILDELQTKTNSIHDLSSQLSDAKEKYKKLEYNLEDDDKSLHRKVITLERNLDKLTSKYYSLMSKKSRLQIEQEISEKKFKRLYEKFRDLQEKSDEQIGTINSQDIRIRQLLVQYDGSRINMTPLNIRKTINGGGGKLKSIRKSLIPVRHILMSEI